jgi:hypothetical protein
MSYGTGGASGTCRCIKCSPHWDDDNAQYMRRLAALRAASLSGFSAHSTHVPLNDDQLVKAPSAEFIRRAMGHYVMMLQQSLVDPKAAAAIANGNVSPTHPLITGWPIKLDQTSALTELEQLNTCVSAARDTSITTITGATSAMTARTSMLPPPSPTPRANKVDFSHLKPKRTYTTSTSNLPSPNGSRRQVNRDERGRPLLPSSAKPNVPLPASALSPSSSLPNLAPSPSPTFSGNGAGGALLSSRSPSPSPPPHQLRTRPSSSTMAIPLATANIPQWARDGSTEQPWSPATSSLTTAASTATATARSLSVNGHGPNAHHSHTPSNGSSLHRISPSTDSFMYRPSSPSTTSQPGGGVSMGRPSSSHRKRRDVRLLDAQLSVIFAYLDATYVLRTVSLVSRRWQTTVQLPTSCSRLWSDFRWVLTNIFALLNTTFI